MNPWLVLTIMIFLALGAFSFAAVMLLGPGRSLGRGVFAAGAAFLFIAVATRAVLVGHAPLQSMFEVFLVLAALAWPMSLLARRFLGVGAEWVDAAAGAVLLVPVAFVFSPHPRPLPPALQSWLFVPHVMSYMLAYILLAKAGVLAGWVLLAGAGAQSRDDQPAVAPDEAVRRLVRLALPLMSAGLLLGAVWGRRAWGNWWNWDPKEMMSLATWLVFLAYLHLPWTLGSPRRAVRFQAAVALAGVLLMIATLLVVNLAPSVESLHSYAN